jgi:hypothetical protein
VQSYIYVINNAIIVAYSNETRSVKLVNINDEATAMVLGFQARRSRCDVLLTVGMTKELKGVMEATMHKVTLFIGGLYFYQGSRFATSTNSAG